MSLKKQQDFLARLYTDTDLRLAFLSQPEKIGAENGLSEKEIADLSTVLPDELNFFAESLIWKRLREAEKLLPLTKKVLGEDFQIKFREFSATYNPRTVKKHLEDAIQFCKFLQKRESGDLLRNLAKFERTRLEFFGFGKRFAFCFLKYDVEEISRQKSGFKEEIIRKPALAVWVKVGGKARYFNLFRDLIRPLKRKAHF